MLKVHFGHRYRPHRTVRLRLNTQVREKEGRDRPFSVFEPHNREQTYASGIPFCSAYCPERTHKYTFYPIKMQEIPTKTSFMDNYSFAPCRQLPPSACRQPPAACRQHKPSAFLSSVSCFCLLLPPPARRPPFSACRQSSTLRLPSVFHPPPAVSFHPCALAICRPTAPHRPLHPARDGLPSPAATDSPPRPQRTPLPGCDGQKKCDPKVALESFQISVKQIFTNSINTPHSINTPPR